MPNSADFDSTHNHADMQHRVSLYQDRALSRSDMRLVEAHLKECESCRATCDAYSALEKQLRTFLDVPRSLVPDLKSSIVRYTSERSRKRAVWLRTLRGGGAVLSLLLLVGGFVFASVWVATGGLAPQLQFADVDPADAVQAIAQYTPTQDSALAKAAVARFTALAETANTQSDVVVLQTTPEPSPTQAKTAPPASATTVQAKISVARNPATTQAGVQVSSPKQPLASKTAVSATAARSVAAPVPTSGSVAQSSPLPPLGAQFQAMSTATNIAAVDTAPISTAAVVANPASVLCILPGVSPDGTLSAAFASSPNGYIPLITDSTTMMPRANLPALLPDALNLSPDTKNNTCGKNRALWLGSRLVSFLYRADNGSSVLVIVDAQNGSATTLAAPTNADSVSLTTYSARDTQIRATLTWRRTDAATQQEITLIVGLPQPHISFSAPLGSITP